MKYTKTQIERALKKLKNHSFASVADTTGINIHTLRYYAKSQFQRDTTKNSIKNLETNKKAKIQERSKDIDLLARTISTHIISDLRQIFRT